MLCRESFDSLGTVRAGRGICCCPTRPSTPKPALPARPGERAAGYLTDIFIFRGNRTTNSGSAHHRVPSVPRMVSSQLTERYQTNLIRIDCRYGKGCFTGHGPPGSSFSSAEGSLRLSGGCPRSRGAQEGCPSCLTVSSGVRATSEHPWEPGHIPCGEITEPHHVPY